MGGEGLAALLKRVKERRKKEKFKNKTPQSGTEDALSRASYHYHRQYEVLFSIQASPAAKAGYHVAITQTLIMSTKVRIRDDELVKITYSDEVS